MPNISAPPYVVQLFFQGEDGSGWSEKWWWHADSYQGALDDWKIGVLGNLTDLRLAMICPTISCTYVRISDSTVKRDTLVAGFTIEDGAGTYTPTAGTDAMPAEVAILLRLQGTNDGVPAFVLHPLRGIPEDCVKDGKMETTTAFNDAWVDFKTALLTKGRMVLKTLGGPVATTIDSIEQMHMTRRKAGRFFGQSRGRSMRP